MSREKFKISPERLRGDLDILARIIRTAREAKHLTRQEVARRIGISTEYLKRLESPGSVRSIPSSFLVARLAKVLGKDVGHFLDHVSTEDEMTEKEFDEAIKTGRLEGVMASGFTGSSTESKRDLLRILKRLESERNAKTERNES